MSLSEFLNSHGVHYINKLHHILSLPQCFIVKQHAYSAIYCLPNGLNDFTKKAKRTNIINCKIKERAPAVTKIGLLIWPEHHFFIPGCMTLVIKINVKARHFWRVRRARGYNFAHKCQTLSTQCFICCFCCSARLKKYLKLLITRLGLGLGLLLRPSLLTKIMAALKIIINLRKQKGAGPRGRG